jgi:N-methylhydantoinase A
MDNAVELVNFHLVAFVGVQKPELVERANSGASLDDAVIGRREVDFDEAGVHSATIYDGIRLEPGMSAVGPAVIQEPTVTLPIPPGVRAELDAYGSYHVHLESE